VIVASMGGHHALGAAYYVGPAKFPSFIVVAVIVAVALLLIFKGGAASRAAHFTRTCRECGANHPGFARFCRRCGKRL
jgi:hypothetical protein